MHQHIFNSGNKTHEMNGKEKKKTIVFSKPREWSRAENRPIFVINNFLFIFMNFSISKSEQIITFDVIKPINKSE